MLKITSFLSACALISPLFAESPVQSADTLFKKGAAAEKAGDVGAANAFYTNALKVDPHNADARYSLGQLQIHSAGISAKAREAKFGAVIIPVFQLDNASFKEAIEAFSILIEKQSKGEVAPNFVIEDPKNLLAEHKLTLNLKNLPAQAVMKYLLDQTGAKARYDEHAVVISAR